MATKFNPFHPNGVVPPNLFAGRKDYCLKILQKIAEAKAGRSSGFFLFGDRGIGKSALAKLIGYLAKAKDEKLYNLNLAVSYYPVEQGQTFRNALEASLNSLMDAVPSSAFDEIKKRAGDLFKNGKFTIGAFGGSVSYEQNEASSKEKDVTVRDQAISILTNVIRAIKNLPDPKDGILLIIDEMQNVADIETSATIIRGLLSALEFKEAGNISVILIGLDNAFDGFMAGDPSARRNFDPVKLTAMPKEDAMEVLRKGFKSVDLKWDEAELSQRIYVTGGYPHSIQVVGRHLVDVDTDGNIDSDDWHKATELTANELREKEFSTLYSFDKKNIGRDKVLNLLALFGRMERKKLIVKCEQAYGSGNYYQHIKPLIETGAIKVDGNGVVDLHSQLFRTAILSTLLDKLDPETPLGKMWREEMDKFWNSLRPMTDEDEASAP